ncbi:zinc metalloproteinase nas-13-like [Crassostrea virginica]
MTMKLLGLAITFAFVCQVNGMTMDEAIADANENSMAFDLVASESSGTVRLEHDILMPLEEYLRQQREREEELNGKRKKRKAIRSSIYRWTNNVVPYEIEAGVFSASDLNEINAAINNWNSQTCLVLRPRNGEADYVRIQQGSGGCSSFVGRIGGQQSLNLANGCRYRRIVEHEIGHAIGFWHEQSRADRDGFVTIITGNIISGLAYNFDKKAVSEVNNYGVAYDYRSVMHYGPTAFSTNGQPTIRTVDPAFQNIIGNAPVLSFRDIKLANLMYTCSATCPAIQCPGEGYVGKDCGCKCPSGDPNNPVQNCASIPQTTTTTQSTTTGSTASTTTGSTITTTTGSTVTTTTGSTVTTTTGTCNNRHRYCGFWARFGFCTRSSFMKLYCRQSCNLCNAENRCEDYGNHCSYLRRQGLCTSRWARNYMRANCAATCQFCQAGQLLGVNTQSKASKFGFASLFLVLPMFVLSRLQM